MTGDISFNIKFVKAVKKRKCLWDYTKKEYSSRGNFQAKAWKEVGLEVKQSVKSCQERWRYIRNNFSRRLKILKSGSGAKTKKEYYLAPHLQFIVPFLKSKSTNRNLSLLPNYVPKIEEDETHTLDSQETSQDDVQTQSESNVSQLVEERQSSFQVLGQPSEKKRRNGNLSAATDAIINWMEKNNEEDANLLFLKSLLPDFKKMDDKQNRRFRRQVIELVDEILSDPKAAETKAEISSRDLQF